MTTVRAEVTQVLIGPPQHGVVRFGRGLIDALQQRRFPTSQISVPCVGAVELPADARSGLVHVQFTDHLFGPNPNEAAAAFTALADAIRAAGGVVTATLHDLPQPSDGRNYPSRVAAYRAVLAACAAVALNSDHERELLRENSIDDSTVYVIPLPIPNAPAGPAPAEQTPLTLGVFGFIYPGKGHGEVIEAAEGLPPDIEVHAIGSASPGHEQLIDQLHCAAARQRRVFHVSGHIDDDRLVSTLRAITVPITAHRHISASGSLNSWLTAGRRPLAPATRYTTEVERRNPGCLHLFPDTRIGLRRAIRAALSDPPSTFLADARAFHPSPAAAAAAYIEMFRAVR